MTYDRVKINNYNIQQIKTGCGGLVVRAVALQYLKTASLLRAWFKSGFGHLSSENKYE